MSLELVKKRYIEIFSLLGSFLETQTTLAAKLASDAKYHTRYLKGKSLFNKKDILVI